MEIRSIQLGPIGTNCYLFWKEGSGSCALVDPGDQGERVLALLRELGLTPQAILLTHSHFDHIMGIPPILEAFPGLPVYCHPADVSSRRTENIFGMTVPSLSSMGEITPYEEGDALTAGGMEVKVLHTPGHTPGSVTLMVEEGRTLFTGDTLFRGSCGRTDLPGGNYRQLMASLARLGALAGDYAVCPGHEGASTLEEERQHNYYMREAAGR